MTIPAPLSRVTAALVLALSLSAQATLAAPPVTPVASIEQPREDGVWGTVCTAFSIDQQRGLFLTAAHCLAENMTLDGQIAWVVYRNEKLDLAVLESRGAYRPALKPCAENAKVGDMVVAVGHAYGLPVLSARIGHVAIAYAEIPFAQGGTNFFMVTDFALIGGMSGGPMLGETGCVIAINQQGNAMTGLGAPIEVITAATRQFWARP